jgi:coenzyme F420-reducing hydrogenase alpha subunit
LRIIAAYQEPSFLPMEPRAAVGHAATEAPRGMLYQRHGIDADGLITEAHIVPPTSQNQSTIERDLWRVAEAGQAMADADLQARCEQAIRNHDPCISCAAHFLNLTVDRG